MYFDLKEALKEPEKVLRLSLLNRDLDTIPSEIKQSLLSGKKI